MGYVICRKKSLFRKEWLVQEMPELWGERNYARFYCKEGDANHVVRRSREVIFVQNTRAPRVNWPEFPFAFLDSSDASRKRLPRPRSAVHAFAHDAREMGV